MLLLARVIAVSRFDVALPFVISAGLLLVSSFTTLAIRERLEKVLTEWFKESKIEVDKLPVPQEPGSLASTSAWTVDAGQILAAVLGPLIALLILRPRVGDALSLLYFGSFVVAVIAFFAFTFKVRADRYGARTVLRFFTPLGAIGIALNLAAAAVAAWAIGP